MNDKKVMQMALDANTVLLEFIGMTSKSDFSLALAKVTEAIKALRTALAQPEPEPVGRFAKFSDGIWKEVTDGSAGQPLYTAPPAKEWAGLTDDEYELMAEKRVTNYFFNTLDYAHDIEAMLKEKNT